jgi:hypothetical protein
MLFHSYDFAPDTATAKHIPLGNEPIGRLHWPSLKIARLPLQPAPDTVHVAQLPAHLAVARSPTRCFVGSPAGHG